MIELVAPIRQAMQDDALALAELVNMAGEGMPLYLWTNMAGPGESPWDLGQSRAQREDGAFSYRNTVLREVDGEVVACLMGYPLKTKPDPPNYDDMPAMFVSLQQLEDLAADTWYINVLATYPQHRGKGFGREFLNLAESMALDTGKTGTSLIVADRNEGARRLYERHGYREAASRPMVKENWQNPSNNWVLLIKTL